MTAAIAAQLNAAKRAASATQPARTVPSTPKAASGPPAPRTAAKPRHLEAALQVACVTWFRLQYPEYGPLLFAVPNGGQRRKSEAARLKAEGTTPGVPDLCLAVASNSAPLLWLELKIAPNKPSDAQRAMIARLAAQGHGTALIYSFDAFRAAVRLHIGY